MRNLIDREKLREDVLKFFPEASNVIDLVIEREPGVEAEPVVHAHWKDCGEIPGDGAGRHEFECSFCGWYNEVHPIEIGRQKYCWHCGARMDEEADDA